MAVPGKKNADGSPAMELTVFLSHPIYGLSYIQPNKSNAGWIDIVKGFTAMPTQGQPDELSDILPVVRVDENGFQVTDVYVAQTFMPNIFRLDWEKQQAVKIYAGTEPADTIDGLGWTGGNLVYTSPGSVSCSTCPPDGMWGVPRTTAPGCRLWQRCRSRCTAPTSPETEAASAQAWC